MRSVSRERRWLTRSLQVLARRSRSCSAPRQAEPTADALPAGSPSALMMEALEAAVAAARDGSDHTGAALEQIRACLCVHHYSKPASMVMDLQACLTHEMVDETQQLWWVRRVLQECALRDLPVPDLYGRRDAAALTRTSPAKEASPASPTDDQLDTWTTALEASDLPDAVLPETLDTPCSAQLRIQVKHEQDGGGWQRGRHGGKSEERAPDEHSSTAT